MTFPADFRRVTTRQALIAAIGTDEATFEAILAFDPPRTRDEQIEALQRAADAASIEDFPVFLRHDIPKRNRQRGHRTVWESLLGKPEYRTLARRLETFSASPCPAIRTTPSTAIVPAATSGKTLPLTRDTRRC